MQATLVALDAEWAPDCAGRKHNPASILQLAFQLETGPAVFVVDIKAADGELQEFVRDLLMGDSIKLVFGSGDAERLGTPIVGAMDVQEDSMSLGTQARRAGLLLNKSKQLQASDWSARPLREEQVLYAATDALVLLELHRLTSLGHNGKPMASLTPASAKLASTSGRGAGANNAIVEYTAIFLQHDARRKLLRLLPPMLSLVLTDHHMTLAWRPESAKGLAVGTPVKLRVEGSGCNGRVQAVSVTTIEAVPRAGHVTISQSQDAEAVEANELTFDNIANPFTLDGILGAGLVMSVASHEVLPEKIVGRVSMLTENGQPGQSERFDELTDSQRHALHVLADELGLEHRSEGKKHSQARKLILTIPKRWRKPEMAATRAGGERTVVKDPKKFAAYFGDVPGLFIHGRISRAGGVCWEPGLALPAQLECNRHAATTAAACYPPLAVVLRGFPGCGKSSLAEHLRKKLSAQIIRADDFWTGTDGLKDAHQQCHNAFVQVLGMGQNVVVDNTNVRKSDYAFYRDKAEAAEYSVCVLEIICENTTELEKFRKRSVHDVPGSATGNMWSRWEHDNTALRLTPYIPQQLMPWLI
jgi:predicted kinase